MSDTPRTDEAQFGTGRVSVGFARYLERELNAANDRIKLLEDCVETAWVVIANVDSGSWGEQRASWREAAILVGVTTSFILHSDLQNTKPRSLNYERYTEKRCPQLARRRL